MIYLRVRELAVEGAPVTVTRWVLNMARQPCWRFRQSGA